MASLGHQDTSSLKTLIDAAEASDATVGTTVLQEVVGPRGKVACGLEDLTDKLHSERAKLSLPDLPTPVGLQLTVAPPDAQRNRSGSNSLGGAAEQRGEGHCGAGSFG